MGTRAGSIIAVIMTTHMLRNDAAAPGQVWPGARNHTIDIVQSPGIGISPIADIDVHQRVVSAALATKSSAATPKKARSEAMIRLSACRTRRGDATRCRPSRCAQGCAVEPLVHAPEAIQSAREGGVRVVDDAVLEDERAHAGALA